MLASASLLESALHYAALGWPVIPLHTPVVGVCDCPKRTACDKPGKHPRTLHGLDDATTDTAQIERWWKMFPTANIGIHLLKAGLVDIAPDSIIWNAQFVGWGLAPTAHFLSGGGEGHEHNLYRRPDDCPTYRLCKPDEYDLLSNGYAVMPPSIHQSGSKYTWLNDPATVKLAPAPQWAVDMLTEGARRNRIESQPIDLTADDEAPVQLRGEALERWNGTSVTLKGNGTVDRSRSLFQIACDLVKAGATRTAVVRALIERDEALGWSKYSGRRDATTRYVVIADRAREGQPPRLVVPSTADRVQPCAEAVPHTVWAKPISALLGQPEVPVDWLCDQLFSVGASGFVAAEPKVGKSWIALELSYCLATGLPFLGRFDIPKRRRVLFIEEEDPERRMLRRFNRLLKGTPGRRPPGDTQFHYVCRSGFRLDDEAWMTTLRGELDSFKPDVVVLDVFNKLHLKDENSQSEISAILHDLGTLTREFGAAFLIIHHYRKSGVGQSARGNQMLRGTSALAGYAECSLYLRKGKSKQVIICEPESKDAPELESFEIRLEDTDNDGSRLVAAETTTRVREAEEEQAVLEAIYALERESKDVVAENVGQETGWDRSKANRVLNLLVSMGKLDSETVQLGRRGYRMYRLPTSHD